MDHELLNDARDKGFFVFQQKNDTYSCEHLLGRGLLSTESLITPKLELHSLNAAANIYTILNTALSEWTEVIFVGGDSEISLSWVMYETNKLDTFTRNRVINVRGKIPLTNLHHIEGKENLSDLGTRPENVTPKDVHPQSEYATGKDWMKLTYDEEIQSGIVRKLSDIKLDHESKKKLKEGLVLEKQYEKEVKGFLVRASESDPTKIVECEEASKYVYPPLKYNFRRLVRTIACILLAVKKWKLLILKKKAEGGINTNEEIEKITDPRVKFKYFLVNEENVSQLRKSFNVLGFVTNPQENGDLVSEKKRYFSLADIDLSTALEYLYKIATQEVFRYVEKRKIEEISIMSDGILYYKSRVLDGAEIKAVGGLEEMMNIQEFTGYNFKVPILYRYSPLAWSIAIHLHYNIHKHKGLESSYRLSLGFVHILQGRAVFRKIVEDCYKCKAIRKRCLKVEMGALHEAQLIISPVFYTCMLDVVGPFPCFCPGFERITRNKAKEYKVYILAMICLGTGTLNLQMIESVDTGGILSGLNRMFFEESTVPKILFPDEGSSLMKTIKEMSGTVRDLQWRLAQEKGIYFETCAPQGHSSHGKIERIMRSLRESIEIAEVKKERLTVTAWTLLAKGIQDSYNNLPICHISRRTSENASLLQILTPNLLKGKFTNRAPVGLFEVTRDIDRLLEKIQTTFKGWYQIWNTLYLPQILSRQKWFSNSEETLTEDDIVLFKLKESEIAVQWVLGKVDSIRISRDGLTRDCIIIYKSIGETDSMLTVQRPTREVVKLFNVEDTSLYEDIENARRIAEEIIKENNTILKAFQMKIKSTEENRKIENEIKLNSKQPENLHANIVSPFSENNLY